MTDAAEVAPAEEILILHERFSEAMAVLKRPGISLSARRDAAKHGSGRPALPLAERAGQERTLSATSWSRVSLADLMQRTANERGFPGPHYQARGQEMRRHLRPAYDLCIKVILTQR